MFIWEPSYNYDDFYIPILCKQHDIRIIALPHNLESMVNGNRSYISNKIGPNWFSEELAILKYCDEVFTISLEDQWLLSNYAIKAKYLEYFPSDKIIEQSQNIAKARRNLTLNSSLLMLGSANNEPTADGMRDVIEYLIKNPLDVDLIIGGYGTEKLSTEYKTLPKNISIVGTVDMETFDNLLKTCKALLIYQNNATGVLTRIPEFILAEIPIIANNISLRSYHNIKGLYPIHYLKELSVMLLNTLNEPYMEVDTIRNTQINQIKFIQDAIARQY